METPTHFFDEQNCTERYVEKTRENRDGDVVSCVSPINILQGGIVGVISQFLLRQKDDQYLFDAVPRNVWREEHRLVSRVYGDLKSIPFDKSSKMFKISLVV